MCLKWVRVIGLWNKHYMYSLSGCSCHLLRGLHLCKLKKGIFVINVRYWHIQDTSKICDVLFQVSIWPKIDIMVHYFGGQKIERMGQNMFIWTNTTEDNLIGTQTFHSGYANIMTSVCDVTTYCERKQNCTGL